MTAQIINLDAARKARQIDSRGAWCVFLRCPQVWGAMAEAWLLGLCMAVELVAAGFGAEEATAVQRTAELPRGQSGDGAKTPPGGPRIDDLKG